jgi:hypothetical protein
MRRAVLAVCLAMAFAAAPAAADAQSALVDLSKPQSGKARFVLNADLTPADLGRSEEKQQPALAAARVPACGEGCKMEQPELPREARSYSYSREPGQYRSDRGTRVILIGNFGPRGRKAAESAPAPRKTLRFRRR